MNRGKPPPQDRKTHTMENIFDRMTEKQKRAYTREIRGLIEEARAEYPGHISHSIVRALEAFDKKYEVGYGVESLYPEKHIEYINSGDCYIPTVAVSWRKCGIYSDSYSYAVHVGWTIAE